MHRRLITTVVLALSASCTFAPDAVSDAPATFGTPVDDLGALLGDVGELMPPPTVPAFFVSDLRLGGVLDLAVSPVATGTVVYFFASLTGPGAGPCHPSQPVCLDIRRPVQLGRDTTGANGIAQASRVVPGSLGAAVEVYFQAVVLQAGSIYKTPVVRRDILSTATDTAPVPPDSADTDLPVVVITDATPQSIHSNLHSRGQLLRVQGLVVTATRVRASPPGSNAFVAQAPNVASKAGIYVSVGNTTAVPALGDVVTVIGEYEEWPSSATSPPSDSLSRLVVTSAIPSTSFTVTASGQPLPPRVPVSLAQLQSASTAENYESMRVRLIEATPLEVAAPPLSNGDFRLSTAGSVDEVLVEEEFYDLRTAPGFALSANDTFTSMSGILHYEVTAYKIAPVSAADAAGYVDN